MIKIGVIVPVYNVEKYLSKCIESILNQTYQNLEIILVDDGSTDSSGEICDAYAKKDTRIKVIHQQNGGLLNARYVGLLATESKFATFVDSDDWLALNTYELASKYLNESIDMVAYGIIRHYANGMQLEDCNAIKKGEYFRKDIEKNIIPTMIWDADLHTCGIDPSTGSKIAKKELWIEELKSVKDLHVYYAEDAVVVYPMIMKMNHIIIMDECLYYHRLREEEDYPSYLIDEHFYDKLFKVYLYLKEIFKENLPLTRQLEYFYLHAIEVRLRIYGERRQRNTYTFPFDIVEKGSRVVLYGAGTVGQEFYRQVKQIGYCEIKLWVDMCCEKYPNYDVKYPKDITTIEEYDYIVIANASKCIVDEIRTFLADIGVVKEKIVWNANSTGGK